MTFTQPRSGKWRRPAEGVTRPLQEKRRDTVAEGFSRVQQPAGSSPGPFDESGHEPLVMFLEPQG